MLQEIEELWALADECKDWAMHATATSNEQKGKEFLRLSKKLDNIAKRLAARLPT